MLDHRILTFLCVCRHLNYTKAAEELHLTQPAVSQHIRYLEQYYKVKLFRYHHKTLELTDQGRYLQELMETLRHDTKSIREEINLIQKRKRLHLGATLSIGDYDLPDRLADFMRRRPEINWSVTVADTSALLAMLDAGTIDCALCEGYFNKSHYAHMPLKTESMCLFCAKDYRCAEITCLEDLFCHPLLIREKGSGTRETFERYLHESNYSLDNFPQLHEIASPHLIIKLLLAGRGISALYRVVGEKHLNSGELREIRFPGFQISHEFNAIWKRSSIFDEQYRRLIQDLSADLSISVRSE